MRWLEEPLAPTANCVPGSLVGAGEIFSAAPTTSTRSGARTCRARRRSICAHDIRAAGRGDRHCDFHASSPGNEKCFIGQNDHGILPAPRGSRKHPADLEPWSRQTVFRRSAAAARSSALHQPPIDPEIIEFEGAAVGQSVDRKKRHGGETAVADKASISVMGGVFS